MRARRRPAGLVLLSAAGCTPAASTDTAAPELIPTSPLELLGGPDSGFTVDTSVSPVVEMQGRGASTITVSRPSAPAGQLVFYVTCAPDSQFTVTMAKAYSGACTAASVGSSGGIPIPAGTVPVTVSIDVPENVSYWLLGMPGPAAE